MEATILICKCTKSKETFGIRVEKIPQGWAANWAFPISESASKKEGYSDNKVTGVIYTSDEYPGCPYCGSKSFYQCGTCGKLSCIPSNIETGTNCTHCGTDVKFDANNHDFNVDGNSF